MIELHIDVKDLEAALTRLNGAQARLDKIVRDIIPTVARRVRQDVLGYLDENVALAPQRGALIKRAVKAVRNFGSESRFVIASKQLLLGDYDVAPLSVTAKPGVRVKSRKPFHYHLRKHGELYSSLSTLAGRTGNGSIPFIARSTRTGDLRVMYRSANHADPLLMYAPSVQYHAANPELEERAQEISSGIFREELQKALDMGAIP